MTTKIFLLIPFIFILISCKPESAQDIRKTEWLLGTWVNNTSQGSIYERWSRISPNELQAKSYFIKEGDTIIYETIRLVQEKESVFYIPTVNNQNDGAAIRFSMKSISDTAFTFENPQHDFPQVIGYRKINDDSLVAYISGNRKGEESTMTFYMKRLE